MLPLPRFQPLNYQPDMTQVGSYAHRYQELTHLQIVKHCLSIGRYHYLPILQLLLCDSQCSNLDVYSLWNRIQKHPLLNRNVIVWRINHQNNWVPYVTYWFYETYINPLIREYEPTSKLKSRQLHKNYDPTTELWWLCEKDDNREKYQTIFGRHYDIFHLQQTYADEPTGGMVYLEKEELFFEQGVFPGQENTIIIL